MGRPRSKRENGATLGFEATLWAAADKLRGHMDPAEYKHVVLRCRPTGRPHVRIFFTPLSIFLQCGE